MMRLFRTSRFLHLLTFVLLSVTLAVPAGAQGHKELTVERIYGQPSLSGSPTPGLQWSPDGKLLSYIGRNGQGRDAKMEVWVIEAATGQRRVLVDAAKIEAMTPAVTAPAGIGNQQTGLGRLAPQRFEWAPGSDALLFTARGNLFWLDLKTQTSRQLTSGAAVEDPKISPDGRWVSFLRDYDLWVVSVGGGKERRLTQGGREEMLNGQLDWVYPEELDLRTAYWWSPDSSRIAYLQMDERPVTRYPMVDYLTPTGKTEWERYPKAGDANPVVRVGVLTVKDGKTRWMDTGAEKDIYLPRVEWLPDSKRVAIQRLNRAQNKLELLFADAATGKSQVILTEEDPDWINIDDSLYFLADGKRFLWGSERDGYRHLYLYDVSGKQIRQVTGGAWEVTQIEGVNEKEGTVFFTATEKSPLERHLYRTGIESGVATRLTREDGTHSINLSPDTQFYVDAYSNAMTPTRQDLYRADGTRTMTINENKVAELAEYDLQPVEFLQVRGADGRELNAMMIKPPGFNAAKKYPVLVYTYGGPHAQIVRDAWGGTTFLWHQLMAQKGYIVFGLDNRGSAGRGHAFESEVHLKFGRNELADQIAGTNYLKSLPYVDGARIGIWGWSYGGYMTCFAMTNAPDVFKAGFAGSPVTDWRQYDTIYTERYMGRPQDNADGYRDSSPVNQVAQLRGKLLIAYGTGDDNVHFANSVEFAEELIKSGRYAEFMMYPGRGHGISDSRARIHLFKRVTQFFLDNL